MKLLLSIFFSFLTSISFSQDQEIIELNPTTPLKNTNGIQSLNKVLEGKRIVFLGDIIHGEYNIDSIRGVLANYLIEDHGFNTIAFESGIYDLFVANKELENGGNIGPILSESIYDVWGGTSLHPLLHAIEAHKEVDIIGVDPEFSGIHHALIDEHIVDFLEHSSVSYDSVIVRKFRELCGHLATWDVEELIDEDAKQIIQSIRGYIDQAPGSNPQRIWKQIVYNIESLYAYLKIEGIAAITEDQWQPKTSNTRDRLMAENLIFYLNLFPDAKVIVWGASAHFAKTFDFITDHKANEFKPMGSYFGQEALTIGAMGFTGEYGWTGNIHQMPALPENSVEYKLDKKTKGAALVNLDGFKGEWPLYSSVLMEESPISSDWSKVFDWVIFVNQVKSKGRIYQYAASLTEPVKTESNASKRQKQTSKEKQKVLILNNKGLHIKGQIINEEGEPIPYSSIALKGTPYGAISDHKGNFIIRVPDPEQDTLVFSNVAYHRLELSLSNTDELIVQLKSKTLQLQEIVIQDDATRALQIVNKAIEAIPQNYVQQPFSSLTFFRRLALDSTLTTALHIMLKNFYPMGYTGQVGIETEILQSRQGIADSTQNTFLYQPYSAIHQDLLGIGLLDIISNRKNTFLDVRQQRAYTFELEDIITVEGEEQYIIHFQARRITPKTIKYSTKNAKLFRGKAFINTTDYAITRIQTEIVWDGNEVTDNVLNKLDFKPSTLINKIDVRYKKEETGYFIYYISQYENYRTLGFKEYFYFKPEEFNTMDWNEIIRASEQKFPTAH